MLLRSSSSFAGVANLVDEDLGLQSTVSAIELVKELNGVVDISGTAGLADAVHAQLGVTQVQSAHAELGGQEGANGASAEGVVADDEELEGHTGGAGALLDEDDAGGVCGVALVGVDLDDGTLVHGGLVRGLVLADVVGVDGVGHVGGDEERAGQGLLVGGGVLALVVDLLVALVAGGVGVAGQDG